MNSQNKMDFKICHATANDVERLSSLHCSLFQDGWSTRDFTTFINNDKDLVLVSRNKETDHVVGFIVVRMVLDEAEILTIGISEDYQRSGAGIKLYGELEEILIKKNVATLFLELRRSNHAAAGLYKKAGFKLVAMRKDYYRSLSGAKREDALVMKKGL